MDNSIYLVDEYVTTKAGEPYRLFPFGRIHKGSKVIDVTPELAAKFKLPHFKPAIKGGSHEETTPAMGHIVGLEVRADGLYCVPEFTEKGEKAITEGDYRYHSPEVIWDSDKGYQDPNTGAIIPGPLIVGDALLHAPHLGEAAALYKVETIVKGETPMTIEKVEVPVKLWDRFTAWLDKKTAEPEPEPEPTPDTFKVEETDQYKAVQAELDQYKAKEAQLLAEKAQADLLTAIRSQFDTQEFGMSYVELGKCEESAGMLASMSEEQREWVMRNFKALSAKVKDAELLGERGSSAPGSDNPAEALGAAIQARMDEKHCDYITAFDALLAEKPELFKVPLATSTKKE